MITGKILCPYKRENAKSKYTLNQNRVGKQEFKNNSKNILKKIVQKKIENDKSWEAFRKWLETLENKIESKNTSKLATYWMDSLIHWIFKSKGLDEKWQGQKGLY